MIGDPEANNSGGTASDFSEIDWSSGDHFLKVEIDLNDGNGFIDMGTTQLWSVPYAFFAEEVEEVNPSFVSYNDKGKVETVLYSQLVTPMLKALQEQEKRILEQQNEISRLHQEINKLKNDKSELALLKEQIRELRESMGLAMGEGKDGRMEEG